MEMPNHHSLKWVIFFLGLLASWLSFSGILPFYLFALMWLAVFVFLAVHKSNLRYFVVLFSSWIFLPLATFVKTTQHYFRGEAVFYRDSLSTPDMLNLDAKFRVWNERKGPALWGDEAFVRETNNFTIRFWVTLNGYQHGAYEGTYPDAYHAYQIVRTSGKVLPFEKTTNTVRIRLDSGVFEMSDVKYTGKENLSKCTKAKVAIVNNELLLALPLTNREPPLLYLADFQRGSIIARYFDPAKATTPASEKKIKRKRKKQS